MDKNQINTKNISLIVIFSLVVLWLGGFIFFSALKWTIPIPLMLMATIAILIYYLIAFLSIKFLTRVNANTRLLISGVLFIALWLFELIFLPVRHNNGIVSYILSHVFLAMGIVMILIGVIRKKNHQSNK